MYSQNFSCAIITSQKEKKHNKKRKRKMRKKLLKSRPGSMIFMTGTLIRCMSSQKFAEKGFEITPEQYLILTLLVENGELYQRQLAEITLKDRGNIARIIGILQEKGLIKKITDSNGRRIYKIAVTEKGKELRNKIYPTDIELRSLMQKGISQKEIENTLKTIEKIYKNVKDTVKLQI